MVFRASSWCVQFPEGIGESALNQSQFRAKRRYIGVGRVFASSRSVSPCSRVIKCREVLMSVLSWCALAEAFRGQGAG